jgi:hypothetical protein
MNDAILWIAYLPVLLVTFSIYFVYTTALLPLCMVKMFFHKMVMIFMYSKSYRVHKSEKFMQWVIFLVIGPLRLTNNFLVDLVAFVSHCIQVDLKKTKVSIRLEPLSNETIKMATSYLSERNERMIPLKQISIEQRQKMNILEKIASFLTPKPANSFYTL